MLHDCCLIELEARNGVTDYAVRDRKRFALLMTADAGEIVYSEVWEQGSFGLAKQTRAKAVAGPGRLLAVDHALAPRDSRPAAPFPRWNRMVICPQAASSGFRKVL
jgi:hypothetical protein